MHKYFDYMAAADAAGIAPDDVVAICRHVEGQYASRLLREKHLQTIFSAIAAGRLTVAEALAPPAGGPPDPTTMRMGG